jgi:hypothetical protein
MGGDLRFFLVVSGATFAGTGLYLVLMSPWW